jgi:excisionase family DNA binding protein
MAVSPWSLDQNSGAPVTATEQEILLIKELEQFLRTQAPRSAKLVAPGGQELEIPEPIYQVLRRIVPLLAQGASIQLMPINKELTTQEAADLLNVSRPHLIKMLKVGRIPYHMRGSHRRILFQDLLEYQRRRDAEREEALKKITGLAEEFGYD